MMLAFVGSVTRDAGYPNPPRGEGITALRIDADGGELTVLSVTKGVDSPTFLALSPDGHTLYATSEVGGWTEGLVTAYRVGDNGALTYINKQPTQGSISAQAIVDPTGRWLLVANYRVGAPGLRPPRSVVVLPIEADGGLGPVAHGVTHGGSGPKADRQEGPHPHCVLATPDGRHVLVSDLGIDRLIAYDLDPASGRLDHAGELAMPPGAGPRHLAWVRPGLLVVSGELDNSVSAVAWDGGVPRLLHRATTVSPGFTATNYPSDVHASPDGRFVYVANRGHDSLAILEIDAAGVLAPVGHRATGQTPRQFTLDKTGRLVFVACQDGHEVQAFRRDEATGLLSEAVARVAIGSAMCVVIGEG